MHRGISIAVVGNSACSAEEAEFAERIGTLLASQGATILCGGLGGVMEAVCRGASSKGGLTVGILPGGERGDANPWVDVPIATGMGEARNIALVKSAGAVIAIGGGYGTLSEIAHALRGGTPVVGLNTWRLSPHNRDEDPIVRVHTAEEAVEKALSLAGERGSPGASRPTVKEERLNGKD